MNRLLILIMLTVTFISGCSRSHLDIFPDLEDPTLLERKLPVAQLHADIDAFIQTAQSLHPDLAQYADEKMVETLRKDIKASITEPMTRETFFRHVGRLSHAFQDGHSLLIWPYQEYMQLRENGHMHFPFLMTLSSEGVFTIKEYKSESEYLPLGAKILSVNDVAIEEILANLQEFVGGESRRLREAVAVERFPQMLWAGYGFVDEFAITYQLAGQTHSLTVGVNDGWQAVDQDSSLEGDFAFTPLEGAVGLLKVATFDVDPGLFEDALEQAFASIKQNNISTLIIDIRENGGGNTDTATALAQYIAHKPFLMVSQMSEKLNHNNRGWMHHKGNIGDIKVTPWTDYIEPQDEDVRFDGDVYVLIGPITYSAAIVFATTVQDNQFATLVGTPTGGYANQTAQGNLFNLPNSQLRAYIATRLLVRPSGDTKVAPVIPDILVESTQQDFQQGKDAAVEHILSKYRSTNIGQSAKFR
ncbi:S41 family peptidase [Alteromonas facilis]|uniref:S41 family peptidase n=1 Tax=Alteromonas facilis TaxID=2048004 RepID=UPI000C284342|nr:S41 family peptidase [Alteromonas facilis]